MIVAITGGSGFIGKRLVKRCLAGGHEVRVFTRRSSEALDFTSDVKIYRGDLVHDVDNLPKFLSGVDVLYHCAGEIRDETNMEKLHVTGTKRLISHADGCVKHWVQLSSVGVYGPRSDGIVTEETPSNPKGTYEITKDASDQLVLAATKLGFFSSTILRPSIVYGAGMPITSLFQMISMIDRGIFAFIGKRGASANYVHVDNVVECLVRCGEMKEAINRVYNISDHCTMETFVQYVADGLNKDVPKYRLPKFPLYCVAKTLGAIPGFPLTAARVSALSNYSKYAIDKIVKELNYEHVMSMKDGVEGLVKAWKRR
jgi:nucleoside-diphosphate-sugar epimerase